MTEYKKKSKIAQGFPAAAPPSDEDEDEDDEDDE